MKFGKTVRLSFMLCLTTVFFLLEIIVGYRTSSMALVADSFHMLSDVLALVIALFAVRIAKKESEKSTFGWARAEVLGALVNSVFLCALCFTIIVEAIQRFTKYEEVQDPMLVLIVGGVGLAFNIVGLLLFHDHHGHGHSHGHSHGHHHHNHVEHGHHDHGHTHDHRHHEVKVNVGASPSLEVSTITDDSTEISHGGNSGTAISERPIVKKKKVSGDAIGSLIVIIAASIIWKTDWPKRHYVDPAMSLVSVAIMLFMTIPLLRSSALILLQTVPLHMKARDVKSRLEKVRNKIKAYQLQQRNYQEYQRAANSIKEFFHNEGIHSTTIQPEFVDLGNDYHENVNSNPAFCMLTCPDSDDKACQESLCCPPPKTTANLDATLRQRLVPKAQATGSQQRSSSPVHFHSGECSHGGPPMNHRPIPRDLAYLHTEGPSVIVSPSLPQDVVEILEAERDNLAYEHTEGIRR